MTVIDNAHMLSRTQKAAILMKMLGNEASDLSKLLPGEGLSIAESSIDLAEISPRILKDVLFEFFEVLSKSEASAVGGMKIPREIFESPQESDQFFVLDFLDKADKKILFGTIQNEHPQLIAFILTYIPSEHAGWIIAQFSPEKQADLAYRISRMEVPNRSALKHLDQMLGEKLNLLSTATEMEVGGITSVVNIMRGVGRKSEKPFFEILHKTYPELCDEIKARMFVFEDIILLDDRSIQKVLKDVNMATLSTALKKTTDEIILLITKNLSERARIILKDEIEAMGKVLLSKVEAAQQEIAETIRKMEEAGEIAIQRGEEVYV